MKINLKKIYIIGTSGSGKTYLAKKLSKILKIKNYNLDDINFIKKFTIKLPKNKRRSKLRKLLSKKNKWIIEGIYTDWSIDAIKKSDLIIWLDPPFRVRSFRILKRFFARKFSKQAHESFKDCIDLIKYSYKYKKDKDTTACFRAHKLIIDKHNINFIKLKNNTQINNFLRSLK
jgi:adenylate kinase family enzyme